MPSQFSDVNILLEEEWDQKKTGGPATLFSFHSSPFWDTITIVYFTLRGDLSTNMYGISLGLITGLSVIIFDTYIYKLSFNRDRSTRFEVSPRLKKFFRVMSFGTSWDEKLCKQNLFTMLTY